MTAGTDPGTLAADDLRALFAQGLERVRGDRVVARALEADPPPPGTRVLAWGKAAEAMLAGAVQAAGGRIAAALVVAPADAVPRMPEPAFPLRRVAGDHPVPGPRSLEAGIAIEAFLSDTRPDEPLLVLLSGGASSLAELPRAGVSLQELQALNRELLASGLEIAAMNARRREWSRLKGGGARALCAARDLRVYLISDVPGDDPAVIGSGPFVAADGSHADHRILASNGRMRAAIREAATARGWAVCDHGLLPAADAAPALAAALRDARPGLHLWGGEAPVRLPPHPGRGGRAQHLAAAVLEQWLEQGAPRPLALLAGASDGVDGNSDAAGAVFDAGSVASARGPGGCQARLRPALAAADTESFWAGLGDGRGGPGLLRGELAGYAGVRTNVMDIVIAAVGER